MSNSKCRYCKCELDGEDIFASLSKHEAYAHYTRERLEIAAGHYGWTPGNKKCFRRDVIVQFTDKPQIVICPECRGVFPRDPSRPKQVYTPTK